MPLFPSRTSAKPGRGSSHLTARSEARFWDGCRLPGRGCKKAPGALLFSWLSREKPDYAFRERDIAKEVKLKPNNQGESPPPEEKPVSVPPPLELMDGATADVFSRNDLLETTNLQPPKATQVAQQLGYFKETVLTIEDFLEYYR